MKSPRVGYVLKVYPRLSETFIVNEILELERRGVDVTIFSLRSPRDGRFHEKLGRVRAEVVYLPERGPADFFKSLAQSQGRLERVRAQVNDLLWTELRRTANASTRGLANTIDLAAEVENREIEHLHAHFATSATDVAWGASRLSGTPFSFTAHAKDIYSESVDWDHLRRVVADAHRVVTVCDANVAHLDVMTSSATNVRRIYNGIDLSDFDAAPRAENDKFVILGVGRLVRKKGFDILVQCARLLKERGLEIECRIAGDGEEREHLDRMIEESGVRDVVTLLGAVTNETVRREMECADLLVLPARVDETGNRDALPTVLLEAMALSLPFVSTPITGIPEIAGEDEGGLLVPADDPDALAATVARLASSRSQRGHLGERGRRRAEQLFDIETNVAQLHALFAESSQKSVQEAACTSST